MIAMKDYLEFAITFCALTIMLGFMVIGLVKVWSWAFENVVNLFKLKKDFIDLMWNKHRKAGAKQKME